MRTKWHFRVPEGERKERDARPPEQRRDPAKIRGQPEGGFVLSQGTKTGGDRGARAGGLRDVRGDLGVGVRGQRGGALLTNDVSQRGNRKR